MREDRSDRLSRPGDGSGNVGRLARVSVGRAQDWIDGATTLLCDEEVMLDRAAGRVLAADMSARGAIPACASAATDGFAVRAVESLGAGAYNPLALPSARVSEGDPLPPGFDALVPLAQADAEAAGRVVLVDPVAAGANVDRRGAIAAAGALLLNAETRLTAACLGLLAAAGYERVPVVRRPCVRLAIAPGGSDGPISGERPMLRALIERDGGIVIETSLADAFDGGADIVVIAGSAGLASPDRVAATLAAGGRLEIDGVALAPGETTAFGRVAGGAPAILLPRLPAACLWSYELFAGRAIRRLGGRSPAFPFPIRTAVTARKIVSSIGMTEIFPIRELSDGRIEVIGSFAESGLVAVVAADGFVIVAEESEGYPAGATMTAHFYSGHQ